MKKKNSDENNDKSADDFFVEIPDNVFEEMQKQIENYNKKSDFHDESSEDVLTPEMLLQLSNKQLTNNTKK